MQDSPLGFFSEGVPVIEITVNIVILIKTTVSMFFFLITMNDYTLHHSQTPFCFTVVDTSFQAYTDLHQYY